MSYFRGLYKMSTRDIINNILFWTLIILIIWIAIWKLIGSLTDTAALVTIALFVVSSELLIWKALFRIDNKNYKGFMKIKNTLDKQTNLINNEISHIRRDMGEINAKLNPAIKNK